LFKSQHDLVLVGGGHSHTLFIRMWAMNPMSNIRLTLVSSHSKTAYSGMLPGVLAGVYNEDESFIDLVKICAFANVRFVRDTVQSLDLTKKQILLQGTGSLEFDFLSINTGIVPLMPANWSEKSVGVKPANTFLEAFHKLIERNKLDESDPSRASLSGLKNEKIVPSAPKVSSNMNVSLSDQNGEDADHNAALVRSECQKIGELNLAKQNLGIPGEGSLELSVQGRKRLNIAVVGGGISGIEVAMNMARRLPDAVVSLIHSGPVLIPRFSNRLRKILLREMTALSIEIVLNTKIEAELDGTLIASEWQSRFDQIFWATEALAPDWIGASGLAVNQKGFLRVSSSMQSVSSEFVFGTGDVVSVDGYDLPKSGVYAVRAAPILFFNLRALMASRDAGQSPRFKMWKPQKNFLSLIGIEGKSAIAIWGPWAVKNRMFWILKDRIDRGFMSKFDPDSMAPQMTQTNHLDSETAMICKGCASKVAPSVLAQLLQRPLGKGVGEEDAAAVDFDSFGVLASIDRLTDIVSDPFRFGQIALNHAMSDLYAGLGEGRCFLPSVELPKQSSDFHLRDLRRLMAGMEFQANLLGVKMASAHSSLGESLAVSLAVLGKPLRKSAKKKGGNPGEFIILTKPLGTGVVFAALMRHKAEADSYDEALDSMLVSNREMSEVFLKSGVNAVTDVTGFGLVGHLLELLGDGLSARLHFDQIPKFSGVLSLFEKGIKSTAHETNFVFSAYIAGFTLTSANHILFDPQTSGGLLAFVTAEQYESIKQLSKSMQLPVPFVIGKVENLAGQPVIIEYEHEF